MTDDTQRLVDQVVRANSPLVIQGNGTKRWYGDARQGEVLDVSSHTGIISYAPDELVMQVRAGTTWAEISDRLARENQIVPFDPPLFGGNPTIGGIVGTGLSGPRRPFSGAVRDAVLGVTLLLSNGKVMSFGGQVMKNVAGYDVSRLVAGSLGQLGVILDVSIRLLPAPDTEACFVIDCGQPAERRWFSTLAQLRRRFPITAAIVKGHQLLVRVSGSESAVNMAHTEIHGETIDGSVIDSIRDLEFFDGEQLWRVDVAPDSALLLNEADVIDWGGALRWLIDPDFNVRDKVQGQGHVTLFRSNIGTDIPRFDPLPEPVGSIHAKLKAQFDPRGLFSAYPG